jgi:hypothetical protein
MKNNLPQKYKENLLSKLWRKIRNFFLGNNYEENLKNEGKVFENKEKAEENKMRDTLKIDMSEENRKLQQKEFIKGLEEKPELLEKLSAERLLMVLQYYLDDNNRLRESIENSKVS